METQELIDRTTAALAAEPKNKAELQLLYRHCTGRSCHTLSKIVYTLQNFITNKERYALRVKEAAETMAEAKNSKYRFTQEARNNKAKIILHTKGGIKEVTADTLTDSSAEMILKHKRYAHNIEPVPTADKKAATADAKELETAQARYEELTGEKPGNRKLETLQEAIAAKEAEAANTNTAEGTEVTE